jgi:hypothetical protein
VSTDTAAEVIDQDFNPFQIPEENVVVAPEEAPVDEDKTDYGDNDEASLEEPTDVSGGDDADDADEFMDL